MIGTLVEIVAAWPRQLASPQVLYTDAAVSAGFEAGFGADHRPAGSEACSVDETVLEMDAGPGSEVSLAVASHLRASWCPLVGIEPVRTSIFSAHSDSI